ncbi:hypothetical protein COCHEDRAFT_1027050 [Bipolaris maydis C5]|uniref:Uncharacterized protein n=1 Tax=Cochliobolus heterostrophus (strain C5 / ATCC 48332 / race O) TaxID=701091 RepID=M2URV4_COCH5|nr:hypothetical protein COCHEDRAFT_1027050 [Bipolaris maydis C5]
MYHPSEQVATQADTHGARLASSSGRRPQPASNGGRGRYVMAVHSPIPPGRRLGCRAAHASCHPSAHCPSCWLVASPHAPTPTPMPMPMPMPMVRPSVLLWDWRQLHAPGPPPDQALAALLQARPWQQP